MKNEKIEGGLVKVSDIKNTEKLMAAGYKNI